MFEASIVISTFNRDPEILDLVLFSLSKQETRYKYEVVVVNDGGNDITSILAKYKYDLPYLKYAYNNNPGMTAVGHAYNVGIKMAEGDVIALAGSDVVWTPRVLDGLIKTLNNHPDDLCVAGAEVYGLNVQGNKVLTASPRFLWSSIGNGLVLPPKYGMFSQHCMAVYSHPSRDSDCFGLPMHFLSAFKKSLLLRIGGFNEDFNAPGMGCGFEDTEFQKRLSMAGCKPLWITDKAFHMFHYHNTPGYISFDKSVTYQKNKQMCDQQESVNVNVGREWGVLRK